MNFLTIDGNGQWTKIELGLREYWDKDRMLFCVVFPALCWVVGLNVYLRLLSLENDRYSVSVCWIIND